MKNKIILFLIPALLVFFCHASLFAEDIFDFSDLAEESGTEDSGLEGLDEVNQNEVEEEEEEPESGISISYGGYVKAMAYRTGVYLSSETWDKLQYLKLAGFEAPEKQKYDYMSNVGTRLQLKMEGFIGEKARMFTLFNIEFNEINQNDYPDDNLEGQSSLRGDMDLREAFIEIYQGDWTIKAGRQLVAWGYVEGFETPTDRISARDYSYKSTDLGDTRLPSDGVLVSRLIGDSKLDMLYIPVSKTNVLPKYTNYAFQGEPEDYKATGDTSKYALCYSSSVGNLNFALSWVDGIDPQNDVSPDTSPFEPYSRSFNRVRSPGLDMQYAFENWQAKFAYVEYLTEDRDGTNPAIKNRSRKYLMGGEIMKSGNVYNLYFGQIVVDNYKRHRNNFLLTQKAAVTNFISGYLMANFLHGDALSVTALGAGYWREDGKELDKRFQLSARYRIDTGLDFIFSPAYYKLDEDMWYDLQAEIRYSF